jgi:Ca2+/Na+ antiporter
MHEKTVELLKHDFSRWLFNSILSIALLIGFIGIVIYVFYKLVQYFHEKEGSNNRENFHQHYDRDFKPISNRSNQRRQEIVKKIVTKDREFIDIENYEGTEETVNQSNENREGCLKKLTTIVFGSIFYGFITVVVSFLAIFVLIILILFILTVLAKVMTLSMMGVHR